MHEWRRCARQPQDGRCEHDLCSLGSAWHGKLCVLWHTFVAHSEVCRWVGAVVVALEALARAWHARARGMRNHMGHARRWSARHAQRRRTGG